MLSFMYSVLSKEISGALQGVGLDPQVGFLHEERPGRDSLALDLLEEFRAPIGGSIGVDPDQSSAGQGGRFYNRYAGRSRYEGRYPAVVVTRAGKPESRKKLPIRSWVKK